jgi:hypothetical protein
VVIRLYQQDRDEAAVLGLINGDRLAGQPVETALMLSEAPAGRSNVDADAWADLDPPGTEVLCTASGTVVGVRLRCPSWPYSATGSEDPGGRRLEVP